MTISTTIAGVLVNRFGAIRADDAKFTGRNALIDQIDLQSMVGCVNAVGRTLAKTQAVEGRRAALDVSIVEGDVVSEGMVFVFEDDASLLAAVDWIRSGADLAVESWAINHATGASQRNPPLGASDAIELCASIAANRRVADTLALLDHGAPDAVPPSVRRIAALLDCSTEAAAYIDALETRVAVLEEKVSELRYDVRRVRRAA